ncbi:MAG: hypothetical protein JO314_07360 [Acidobacteria bacterium]|nr:hypothetical protein [Acidobacteriota bacterium]
MFENRPPAKRSRMGLLIGVVVGVLLIGGVATWWLSRAPSIEDQTAKLLEGSLREGSPEFAALAKNIQIARDDDHTVESPTGQGTISMFIHGNVYNKTGKTITLLEVTVSIINQQNQSIRDKAVLVVPVQNGPIAPGDKTPIDVQMGGFDRHDDRANINFKVTAIKVEG